MMILFYFITSEKKKASQAKMSRKKNGTDKRTGDEEIRMYVMVCTGRKWVNWNRKNNRSLKELLQEIESRNLVMRFLCFRVQILKA